MNTRTAFIAVLVLVALLLGAQVLFTHSHHRLVVIGGGLTGLVASVELAHRSPAADVIVVEAQPNVGGRVVSVPVPDTSSKRPTNTSVHCLGAGRECAEIGATFIHGIERNPLMSIVRHYGIETVAISYDKISVFGAPSASRRRYFDEASVDHVKDKVYDQARALFDTWREKRFQRGERDIDMNEGFSSAIKRVLNRGHQPSPPVQEEGTTALPFSHFGLTDAQHELLSWHFYWEIVQDQVAPLHQLSSYSYDASLGFRGIDHIFKNGIAELVDKLVEDFGSTAAGGNFKLVTSCSALQEVLQGEKPSPSAGWRIIATGCPIDNIRALETDQVSPSAIRPIPKVQDPQRYYFKSFQASEAVDREEPHHSTTSQNGGRHKRRGIEYDAASRTQQKVLEKIGWAASFGVKVVHHVLRSIFSAADWCLACATSLLEPSTADSSGKTSYSRTTIHGGRGTLDMDASVAIVTVPLGTLAGTDHFTSTAAGTKMKAAGSIRFEPGLPRWKRLSATKIGCSPTLKFAVRFSTDGGVFWDDTQHFFGLIAPLPSNASTSTAWTLGDADHIEVFNMHHFRKNGILIFEIEGEYAVRVGRMIAASTEGKVAIKAFIDGGLAGRLAAAFDLPEASIMERITGAWANNYVHNPFIRCGFSYWTPGSDGDDNFNLAEPLLGGGLMFAGEHTTPQMYGNMHGAIAEGQRAADDALALLDEVSEVAAITTADDGTVMTSLSQWLWGPDGGASGMRQRGGKARGGFAGYSQQRKKRPQQKKHAKRHFKPAWCPQQCDA